MDGATFFALVALGASFLAAMYLIVRLGFADALKDFEQWKNRRH